jgi:hypothetical protein
MKAKKYLYLSVLIALIFIGLVLYYIVSPLYLGMVPFGIINGTTFFSQILLLFFAIRNVFQDKLQWRIILAIVICIFSIVVMGYFFLIWLMVV